MELITWPVNVNTRILDSTSVTVGNGATISDSIESGGQKRIRLACANPPDSYSVKMSFDCTVKGKDGLTELERFWTWYKWKHCYGVNPFKFPSILLNSNRQQGYGEEELSYGLDGTYEHYRITSAVEASKSGLAMELSMTWETYSTGYISIPDDETAIDSIKAENGCVYLSLTGSLSAYPSETDYTLKINGVAVAISGTSYDGEQIVALYFVKYAEAGTYTVEVDGHTSSFAVEA